MKLIPLSQEFEAIIDNEDYDRVNQYKWYYNNGYAVTKINTRTVYMHRFIMDAKEDEYVDHKETEYTLDNQKKNLRICSCSQNQMNIYKQNRSYSSKYKGVFWYRPTNRWTAQIKFNYKAIHLGYFKNEIDAAKVYDQKALELFGDFAKLNFPELIGMAK